MESQPLEDIVINKVDRKEFVEMMKMAENNGFQFKVKIEAVHPTNPTTIHTTSFTPGSFTFNRVIDKQVNENTTIWKFCHAAVSADNVDEVCDLSEFTINLTESVKGVRMLNNAKAETLKKRLKISKLNSKLKEAVNGVAGAAPDAPAGASGGVASAGGATASDVLAQTPLGAMLNAFSGGKRLRTDM